jgi:diguanylate cyclase (GGDEF)-like protein/PAS domain S-box-containing protein
MLGFSYVSNARRITSRYVPRGALKTATRVADEIDMSEAPLPSNEAARLAALRSYGLLDSGPDPTYEAFANLAAEICEAPMAAISLVDETRQWFKATVGLGVSETARRDAFCAHAILEDGLMEVPDATQDPRFADNPLVLGNPNVRSYAGVPLVDRDGFALGTLCTLDDRPKSLTDRQRELLAHLGDSLATLIQNRRGLSAKALDQLAMIGEALELSAEPAMIAAFDDPSDAHATASIEYVNRAFRELFAYTLTEIVGKSPRILQGPETDVEGWERLRAAALNGESTSETLQLYSSKGDARLIEFRDRPIDASHRIAILRDVTVIAAARHELLVANERLHSIVAHNPDPIFMLDETGACVDSNDEAAACFGYSKEELLEDASHRLAASRSFFPGRERFPAELLAGGTLQFSADYRHRDGRLIACDCRGIPMIVGGRTQGAYVVAKDVTYARRSAERLKRQAERAHALYLISAAAETTEAAQVEAALELVMTTLNMQYGYVATSRDGALEIVYAIGENLEQIGEAIEANSQHILRALAHSDVVIVDDLADGQRSEGVPTYPDWHGYIAAELKIDGKPHGVVGFLAHDALRFDIFDWDFIRLVAALVSTTLERFEHERRLNRLAFFDLLTGLANRAKFMDDLGAAISIARRHHRSFALHYIDLDGFKAVNDRAGHAFGDLALQEAAARLQRTSRRHDVPARLGGDEFVLLQSELYDRSEALAFGNRLVDVLAEPYVLNGETFRLGASVGIAVYPDDGLDARELLKEADVALYRAKANGKNRVDFGQRYAGAYATP